MICVTPLKERWIQVSLIVNDIFHATDNWGTAHLICSTHSAALQALPKLHGHTYKDAIMSCVLKKRLEKNPYDDCKDVIKRIVLLIVVLIVIFVPKPKSSY